MAYESCSVQRNIEGMHGNVRVLCTQELIKRVQANVFSHRLVLMLGFHKLCIIFSVHVRECELKFSF